MPGSKEESSWYLNFPCQIGGWGGFEGPPLTEFASWLRRAHCRAATRKKKKRKNTRSRGKRKALGHMFVYINVGTWGPFPADVGGMAKSCPQGCRFYMLLNTHSAFATSASHGQSQRPSFMRSGSWGSNHLDPFPKWCHGFGSHFKWSQGTVVSAFPVLNPYRPTKPSQSVTCPM